MLGLQIIEAASDATETAKVDKQVDLPANVQQLYTEVAHHATLVYTPFLVLRRMRRAEEKVVHAPAAACGVTVGDAQLNEPALKSLMVVVAIGFELIGESAITTWDEMKAFTFSSQG